MAHNKKKLIALLILALLGLFGVIVFFTPAGRHFVKGSASAEKAVYYCPMHPTYLSDRPGDCPICNMKLVKRETTPETSSTNGHQGHNAGARNMASTRAFSLEELLKMKPGEICLLHKCRGGDCKMIITEESARMGKCPGCGEDLGIVMKDLTPSGYASVSLPEEKQQMLGVKIATTKRMPLTKTIRTVGRIAYDPELYQAQEEFLQALQAANKSKASSLLATQEQALKLVDSAKLKLSLMGLSDELINDVAQAGKPDRSLLRGEPGGTMWLYAPIYEYELPLIKVGQELAVDVPAIPGEKFQGTIRSIDPVLDKMTRSVRIRAVLNNSQGFLKPEMYVNATLQINLGEVLAIPEQAVFVTGEKNVVFVAKPDGVFEPREVVLGAKTGEFYEIKQGVVQGEQVVTSSNFLIDSESRLKAALEGMSGSGHQHGQ